MKRALLTVLGLALLVSAISGLRELTQNRPDAKVDGSTTTVEFDIREQRFSRGEPAAAAALWAVCASTVGGDVSPTPEPAGDGWRVTIEPAIGEHGENRLVGCLEDVTVDRVIGDVTSLRRST